MTCVVKWGEAISRSFSVPLGIKQGGINSPDFFSCYFDDLCKALRNLRKGCHIQQTFLACILFADDLCLLSPSRSSLQRMIDECAKYCTAHVLAFNSKKSHVVVFSKKRVNYEEFLPIHLGKNPIAYTNSVTYLGTSILSDKGLLFSASNDLCTFYRAANALLNTLNRPNEEVQMQLLYANCVPILSYASAVKDLPSTDFHNCNTALNDAIRKVFSFNRWESVRVLRESFGYLSLTEIFAKAKDKFFSRLSDHWNKIISFLASLSVD